MIKFDDLKECDLILWQLYDECYLSLITSINDRYAECNIVYDFRNRFGRDTHSLYRLEMENPKYQLKIKKRISINDNYHDDIYSEPESIQDIFPELFI